MRLSLQTWDDDGEAYQINDGTNYEAVITPGTMMPSATPVFIDLGERDPILAGKTLSGGQFTFHIVVKSGQVEAARDELNSWFRVSDFTPKKLMAYNLDDSNSEWYLEGYPITPPVPMEGPSKFSITLALKQPYWIKNTTDTNDWNIGSSTETQVFTNSGNIKAYPIFRLSPQGAKSSSLYNNRTYCAVYNTWTGFSGGCWVNLFPGGGLDTASEVSGGQMNADGNDLKVLVNGASVPRFFGDMNTDHTNVWVYLTFPKPTAYPLQTALDGSTTPSSVFITIPDRTVTAPSRGFIMIGSELIGYTSWAYVGSMMRFSGISRHVKGTTIAAHSVGATASIIPFDIWVVWGNPSETAPVQDDNLEPSFDLVSSDNDSLVYSTFQNAIGTKLTSRGVIINRGNTNPEAAYYNVSHTPSDGFVYPAAVFGMKISSYTSGNSVINANTKLQWAAFHPGGIAHVTASGGKYRNGSLFGSFTIQNGTGSTVYYTETAPGSAGAWGSISIDTDITNSPTSIIFQLSGSLGTTLPLRYAMAEIASMTLDIEHPMTVFTPTPTETPYLITGYLENLTNEHKIVFKGISTKTGDYVYLDCETLDIYLEDGTRIRGAIEFDGPARDDWMVFEPGDNSIKFYDLNTADLDIHTTWQARNTI